MNVSDLRIGNLVTIDNPKSWANLKGVTLVVANIESMIDAHFPKSTGTVGLKGGPKFIERIHQFDEFIQPIQLTEEWLLKFGFDKVKSSYEEAETFDFELRPLYYCSSDSYWECFNCRIELEYVHELQNLYHAITGKELVASI